VAKARASLMIDTWIGSSGQNFWVLSRVDSVSETQEFLVIQTPEVAGTWMPF
jgi:hypothetical protein